jgi:4-cresol dehydrogenase (hydroxylating)
LDTISALDSATSAWAEAIGSAFVSADPEVLRCNQTATFATSQRVLAVLQPGSPDEVAACMRIANRFGVPVYPISRGRNWGLGSRVPPVHAAILDLGRMNRILELDEKHGTLTLEPGVSFAQAHAFLTGMNSRWFLPVIGGPAEASVIGNGLERGDVVAPLGDGPNRLANLQVILPQGDVVETGYARFGRTPLSALSSMPAGPQADGLFFQGNFGVVTRATAYLSARPFCLQLINSELAEDGLAEFVDALRSLVVQIGAQGNFTLWNGSKLQAREPRKTPSADDRNLARTWFSSIAFYAPSAAMATAQRELVTASRPFRDSGNHYAALTSFAES